MRTTVLYLAAFVLSAAWARAETLEEILRRHQQMREFAVQPFAGVGLVAPSPAAPGPPPAGSLAPVVTRPTNASREFSIDGRATRLFSGPGQFPPTNYAAYGIVAFKSMPDASDEKRYLDICRAYVNAIPSAPTDFPTLKQMVTVWPVTSQEVAARLRGLKVEEKCKLATVQYDLSLSRDYLRRARFQGEDVVRKGPYLLAWAPTTSMDQPDAIVLVADLSDVQNYDQALPVMIAWVEDIEKDPAIWEGGFTVEKLRLKLRTIFDKYGQIIEPYLKVKS